jgi:hypothetical protein
MVFFLLGCGGRPYAEAGTIETHAELGCGGRR